MRSWWWNTASIKASPSSRGQYFLMTFHPVARTSSSWACVTFAQYKLADVWTAPWTGSAKRAALIGHWSTVVSPAESRLLVIRPGAPDVYKHGDLPPSSLPSNILRTITWARMGGRLCRLRSWLISVEKRERAGSALELFLPPEASPVVPPRRHGESPCKKKKKKKKRWITRNCVIMCVYFCILLAFIGNFCHYKR